MNEQEYLQQRLDDQINWYDARSASNKQGFFRLQSALIAAGALVPVLTLLSGRLEGGYALVTDVLVASLGAMVVVLGGVISLMRFHENWTEYRTTAETLKHEKFMFLTRSGPYATGAEPFKLLVERVESLISQQHSRWVGRSPVEAAAAPPAAPRA